MINKKNIARKWRIYRGYTIKYVSEILEICPNTYRKIELNEMILTTNEAKKLSEIFEISYHQLFEKEVINK